MISQANSTGLYAPLGFYALLGFYTTIGFCALLGFYTPLGSHNPPGLYSCLQNRLPPQRRQFWGRNPCFWDRDLATLCRTESSAVPWSENIIKQCMSNHTFSIRLQHNNSTSRQLHNITPLYCQAAARSRALDWTKKLPLFRFPCASSFTMSQYCYSPLSSDAKMIRLLRLMPHINESTERTELQCKLFEYSL